MYFQFLFSLLFVKMCCNCVSYEHRVWPNNEIPLKFSAFQNIVAIRLVLRAWENEI